MNVKTTYQRPQIYLIKPDKVLILPINLGEFTGAYRLKLAVFKRFLRLKQSEIRTIPSEILNKPLLIRFQLEPGTGTDYRLYNWLFNSGVQFTRTKAAKYRFILLGAQIDTLINQVSAE